VTNCTFTNDTAGQFGGAILSEGTTTVAGSTFSGNSALYGGAFSVYSGTSTISNSTFTANSASAVGGGIFNNGAITVSSSTFSRNTAGGGIYWGGSANNMANSIVSGNTGGDISGSYTDNGGNQVSTAVNLSPLGSYGGPTQTMVPMPGSTSICFGTSTNATAAGITTDQRGFIFDPRCPAGSVDSGAVQSNYALLFSSVPHTTVSGQVLTPAPATTLYESGVLSTTPTSAVTLSDASSALSGTTTENLSSGVATFPGVSFTAVGLNTQLIATLALNASVNLVATAGTTTTVSPVPAVLASPSPGSTLTGPVVTFSWSPVSGATAYSLWIGTTGPGSSNLYVSHQTTASTVAVAGLPTTGGTVYVRLYTIFDGVATPNDYTFTASTRAALTAPSSPGTFTGPDVTFSWSPATGAVGYSLWLGSTGVGSFNLYDSGATTALTAAANALPTNGETIYARVNTLYPGGLSVSNDYTYTAVNAPMATLTTPAPSSTLTGAKVTFTWTAATGATGYSLWIGSTAPGSSNLYVSHETTALSATATSLPTNGSPVYVRLYTIYNGVSKYTDYTYTAAP
jgi:predicted outer membrane repeat protein